MSEPEELRVVVYEMDGSYIALCAVYPGLTGEGGTREAAVEELRRQIAALSGHGGDPPGHQAGRTGS